MAGAGARFRFKLRGTSYDEYDCVDSYIYQTDRQYDHPENSVDLRKYSHRLVYDQAKLNSCASNALCAAYAMELEITHRIWFEPSPLFLYYNTRVREGSVLSDDGTKDILDDFKELNNKGVCKDSEWPFIPANFDARPPQSCYKSALQCLKLCTPKRLLHHKDSQVVTPLEEKILQLKTCLSDKCPFVFVFNVNESFTKRMGSDGIMLAPNIGERSIGRHAVVAVGYDKNYFIVLNSWGRNFGHHGYFYMPHNVMVDHDWCFDHYKVSLRPGPGPC